MKYLLDTNICIYIINEKPEKVLRKFEQYPVYEFGISSITHAELQYGIEKGKNKNTNQDALDEFLLPLTILPFHGKKLVTCYGEIRASLESKGKTIGPLVTLKNFREFQTLNVKIGYANCKGLRLPIQGESIFLNGI
jgi:tRNA(fMet)-specific endonuclease VapC